MAEIKLDREQKEQLVSGLQRYCERELDWQLGQFEAEFLLDFVIKQIGPKIYNQGLEDAQVVLMRRFDDIRDDLYQLEQPSQL